MKIKIKKLFTDEEICKLSRDIFDNLGLEDNTKYNVHLGQLNHYSYIKSVPAGENYMQVNTGIFNKLLLYSNAELDIWKKNEDIYLGPVIGIFVNTRYIDSIKDGKPPLSTEKNMQAKDSSSALMYYFSVDNINWKENKIRGYTFIPSLDSWRSYWFPIPDVIYDRGVKFDTEQKMLVSHIREQLRYYPKIKFINSRDYLGKWQCYKYISKYLEISNHLPQTTLYTSFEDILYMLNKHQFIFIKSSYGSRGREVTSIEQIDNKFKVNFYAYGLKESLLKQEELKEYIDKFTTGKQYIIQQGCRLIKYQGHSMDMRILIEKDESGQWKAIYNQCRIAKAASTITNCSTGGSLVNYDDIYSYLVKENESVKIPNYDEIADITIKIATYIEKEYGAFGEFGMDMALDKDGKLWFIEANTKPDKDPEPGLEDMEGVSPQCLSILDYSKFLVKGE